VISGSDVNCEAVCCASARISCFDLLLQPFRLFDRHSLILIAPHNQQGAAPATQTLPADHHTLMRSSPYYLPSLSIIAFE